MIKDYNGNVSYEGENNNDWISNFWSFIFWLYSFTCSFCVCSWIFRTAKKAMQEAGVSRVVTRKKQKAHWKRIWIIIFKSTLLS